MNPTEEHFRLYRANLTGIKGQVESSTKTVGDFNTPLTSTDKLSRQKINNKTQILYNTVRPVHLA